MEKAKTLALQKLQVITKDFDIKWLIAHANRYKCMHDL